MKKLFVSVPMHGRTEENILNSIKQMHKIAEVMFGEELEVIDTYHKDLSGMKFQTDDQQRIYCLGHSIQLMRNADYFIGVEGAIRSNPGCSIENQIARQYDIPAITLWRNECTFLDDMRDGDKSGEEVADEKDIM